MRAYAICQAAGWSAYALAVALPYVPREPLGRMLGYSAALALVGFAQTHALRTYARRWSELSVVRLVPRVAVSSAAMGMVMNLVMLVAMVHYFHERTWGELRATWLFGVLFVSWLWWFFPVFVGWQALYFGVQFVRRAQRAEVERWRLAAEASAAELRLLKAQLDPHFLFNALNGLRGLIAEDPGRAQSMVTRLSAFLRASLSAGADTVPLEDELRVVDDYLAIESVRLEARLRVTRDIDGATLGVPVPAMLVQGLVENGIKHGVALLPEGGELVVETRARGANVEIVVTNTAAAARARGGLGTGIANTRARLRLLAGDRASFELEDGEGVTMARVVLPR